MAVKLLRLISILDDVIPKKYALSWDNCGFQLGDSQSKVSKIFLTLDLTSSVLDSAISNKVNLIISHHPLFFKPIKDITDVSNKILFEMIKKFILNKIALYCAHTSLDVLFSKLFCEKLKLVNLKVLDVLNEQGYGIGCYGYLKNKIEFQKFMTIISRVLKTNNLKIIGNSKKYIRTVGFCGGSGGRYINNNPVLKDLDVFITSDIKYHEALFAAESGLTVIDAGHYSTEMIMMMKLKRYLQEKFKENNIKGIEIIISKQNTNPFRKEFFSSEPKFRKTY